MIRSLAVFASGFGCGTFLMLVALRNLPAWPWEAPALIALVLLGAAAIAWPSRVP